MLSFLLALLPAATALPPQVPNLDFSTGRLVHWEGEGFYVTTGAASGPSLACGVCSDRSGPGGRALLQRTFLIPPGTTAIHFRAAASRPARLIPGPVLDVRLQTPDGRAIDREVHTASGWEPAPVVYPRNKGRPYEYRWLVHDLAGQPVRLVLTDDDSRPGCHLWCSGFHLTAGASPTVEFAHFMTRLVREHHLTSMERLDSKHFVAIGNAAADYTEEQLVNCETIYPLFLAHFRRKRFAVHEAPSPLLVAVFDSQAGLEAYLGHRMPAAATGIYHRPTNRLVVYDYAGNRSFLARQRRQLESSQQLTTDLEQQNASARASQRLQVRRANANIATIMHEVAHQLSFNCGLLHREGDVPAWLAEGLACYCEATQNGSWQGVGEANPLRAQTLAAASRGGALLPLRALVIGDDWLRKAKTVDDILLGYAQSWALFCLLMEQRPTALREYLATVQPRRTPERRLDDFASAFGTDLARFEESYLEYIRRVVREQVRNDR
jgi:hypothetical protein